MAVAVDLAFLFGSSLLFENRHTFFEILKTVMVSIIDSFDIPTWLQNVIGSQIRPIVGDRSPFLGELLNFLIMLCDIVTHGLFAVLLDLVFSLTWPGTIRILGDLCMECLAYFATDRIGKSVIKKICI